MTTGVAGSLDHPTKGSARLEPDVAFVEPAVGLLLGVLPLVAAGDLGTGQIGEGGTP